LQEEGKDVRRAIAMPQWIDELGPRQRDLARIIFLDGGATIREIHAQLEDAPSSVCGVRTLLRRMVRKGILKARPSGRHSELIYFLARQTDSARLNAFERIAREHFEGSKGRAAEALRKLAANRPDQPGEAPRAAA
jgi:predicted transcriptional regulator